MHTTDYFDTFIEVADDCVAESGVVPPEKAERTVARIHYDLIAGSPYGRTSDEVVFATFVEKHAVGGAELDAERARFFSKGRPCLRSSPLGKRYGWGLHFDGEGRVAAYGRDTDDYERHRRDPALTHLKAMKNRR